MVDVQKLRVTMPRHDLLLTLSMLRYDVLLVSIALGLQIESNLRNVSFFKSRFSYIASIT